jgi:hypothetical protein
MSGIGHDYNNYIVRNCGSLGSSGEWQMDCVMLGTVCVWGGGGRGGGFYFDMLTVFQQT